MKRILLSMTALVAAFSLNAQVDTLTEFFTGTPTLYGVAAPDQGYVSGSNTYGDLGKYQRFDATYGLTGNGNITDVLLWMPYIANNGGTFNVDIIDFTGGAAGATLASETVSIATVDTTLAGYMVAEGTVVYNVAVALSTPVAITSASDVVIGITLPTTSGDSVAVVSNTAGDFAAASTHTWEVWSDANFYDVSSAWGGLDIAFGIFPVVNMTSGLVENAVNVSAFPNPASTELTINVAGEATSVSIISMDGKVVATQAVNGASTTVDVSNLNSGVYFYEVAAENGEVIRNTFVKK